MSAPRGHGHDYMSPSGKPCRACVDFKSWTKMHHTETSKVGYLTPGFRGGVTGFYLSDENMISSAE